MATLMQDSGNQYGASQAAYTSWKRCGFPTSEQMPTRHLASRRDAARRQATRSTIRLRRSPAQLCPPASGQEQRASGESNHMAGRRRAVVQARPQMQVAPPRTLGQPQQEPSAPAQAPLISEEQMHTTWSELLRTASCRSLPPSA